MKIRLLVATLAVLFAGAAPAFADIGQTTTAARIYVSKNVDADVVGVLSRGTQIEGQCYRDGWCQVSGGGLRGWIESADVNMRAVDRPQPQPQPFPTPQAPGEQPRPQPGSDWPWTFPTPQPQPQPLPTPQPTPRPPVPASAQACFFSEANFRGSSFCLDRGNSYTRLQTWDNAIRSVQIIGGARVRLCSDQGFVGECANLRTDTSPMPGWLDGTISSVRVY